MSLPTALPSPRTPHPDAAPPLNWGLLGAGWIAEQFADAVQRHTRQTIAAIGSRDQAKADAFARRHGVEHAYGSYEALVASDVDAIYVASPHSHHLEHALLAIAAGKPVLVEKAFTRTAAEARELVDAARAAKLLVMEAMWTRFLPDIDIVRQLLADGVLGDLETLTADHGQWFPVEPAKRLYNPDLAGGALLDLGIYPLSFAFFALGRPGRLVARGTAAATGVDRQVSIIADAFPDHRHAHALLSTTLAAKTSTGASICGSQARIELPGDFYNPQPVTLIGRDGVRLASEAPTIPAHQGLCYEAAHFAQLLTDGRLESPLLPLDETIAVMDAVDEIRAQAFPG